MKTHKFKAILSIMLVMLMAFLLPAQVFAQTLPEPETPEDVSFGSMNDVTTANIVSEIEERRDEITKHFRMDDGTIMAVNYGSPVHYKNSNGKWIEYNNSLIAENDTLSEATADEAVFNYVNKKSDIDIKVAPDSRNEKMIHIGAKKGDISWKYSGAKLSNAKIKNNNRKYKGNEKFTNVDKMTSTAKYENIYENVDLECIVSPTGVKENLILENKDAQNEFEIVYDIKDLTAKQIDDKTIQLYNEKNKKTYKITAPYMYDAEKNVSEDLTLEILSNKNNKMTVKLAADKSFLRSWGRQYPVTIDPEVEMEGRNATVVATISEDAPDSTVGSTSQLSIGNHESYGNCYGIVKPVTYTTLSDNAQIVSAKISMAPYDISGNMSIDIREITTDWDRTTVTYDNINADEILEKEIIDYETVDMITYQGTNINGHYLEFDITKIAKKWDMDGTGNIPGILLSTENTTECCKLWGTNTPWDYLAPVITIIYKEYNGSESHLTSHTVSSGNKGQMSVVHYTGDMVFKQELYSESGSRLPLEIYATYHSAEKTKDNNTGYGWHMSFDKTLTLSDGYYIYTDGDAVKHYFKVKDEVDEEGLTDEDDLGYTLKIDSTNSKITIDDGSVIYTFSTVAEDEISKIQKETDVDNSNNCITYTYNSGNYITGITSSFGNYRIEHDTSQYNASGKRISNIILPDLSTIVPYYFYNANIITNFRFGTNQFATFAYDQYTSTGTMIGATTKEYGKSYRIICDYNSDGKVEKIKEQGYNESTSSFSNGEQISISYGTDNTTTYTDLRGRKEVYTFDEYGNTVSILNADGYLQNEASSGFNLAGGSDSYTKNYIKQSNEPSSIGGSNSEYTQANGTIGNNTSSGGTTSIDTEVSYLGSNSIKINHSEENNLYTSVVQEIDSKYMAELKGGAVTFSAYAKIEQNMYQILENKQFGVKLSIETIDGEGNSKINDSVIIPKVVSSSKWQRLSIYADIIDSDVDSKDTVKIKVYCSLYNALGTVWFDCLQLEEGYIANDYNALTNSDFETTNDWYMAEVTPRETTADDTTPYATETSEISLNENGNVDIQGIGAEPVEETEETIETEPEETDYTGATCTEVVTETEENGVVEVTDAHGNVTKTMQGLVTRQYKRFYESTETTASQSSENNENSEDAVATDEEETEETIPCNKYVYQTVSVNKANVSFNISGTAKAKSVPLNNENRTFGIALKIKYEDDSDFTEQHYQEFNYATTAKQGVCLTVSPENSNKIIETVAFAFVYGYNKNTMTISNAMLNFAYDVTTGNNDNTYTESTEDNNDDSDDEYDYLDEELLSEVVTTNDENHKYMYSGATYDSTGNLVTSQTDESGNTVSYGYDGLGNQISITDGNGNTTSYSYDKLGNLTAIVSGDASNTYVYDDQFRLSSISHNNFLYNFNYDIYNQLINAKVGNQTLVSYTYSNRGLLTSMTYGNGDVLNYSYDNFDRLILITKGTTSSTETTSQVILSYNKKGLVGRGYDYILNEHTYYDYDFHGNLISLICKNNKNEMTYSMSSNEKGDTVEITNINGYYSTVTNGTDDEGESYVSYHGVTALSTSDGFDRMASNIVKYDNGTSDDGDDYNALKTTYSYAQGKAYENADGVTEDYDEYIAPDDTGNNSTTNLVSKIKHWYSNGSSETINYLYDANGNITQVSKGSEVVAKYTYDSLNQLSTEVDKGKDTFTEYSYDNAGNITSVKIYELNEDLTKGTPQSTNTYSYDNEWKDKLTAYNGTTIEYDAIGNPKEYRDSITMTWDNGRELKSFTKDNVTTTYSYDSNGMRVRKNGADGKTQYYYNNDNVLVGTHFDNNTPNDKNDDTVVQFYYDTEGSLTSFRVNGSAPYFYVKNLQGDVDKIIHPNGAVKVEYTYDAWGNVTSVTDNSLENLSTLNPFRYRGYAYDNESGFYYLQSRYYDPQTGRFLNADIYCDTNTGTPLSTNMFAYCENNSIIFIDPEGFKPKNLEQFIRKRNNIDKTDNVVLGGNKIKLKVTGNKVKIIAAVKFSGGLCDKKVRGLSNFTYQKLFIRGVKDFWSGKFKISFPNYDCKYNTELQTEIIKRNTNANVIKMKNMKGVSNVTYYQKWSFENHGELTMYKGDSRNGGCTYTKDQFKYVAAHEFGHLLGVGDMYNTSVSKDSVFNEFNTRVQNRDVKKVLLAFMKEKFQEWE